MTAGSSTVEEPLLTISRPPRFWASPYGWSFAVAATVAVISAVALVAASIGQPPSPVVTLKGIMASKQEFFKDPEVQRLLLKHNISVEVTVRGSREVALEVITNPDSYDFAFPSGQPAANLITNDRAHKKLYHKVTHLFSSPMVLASYREYANTLVNYNNVATAQGAPDTALYYTLDTGEFIKLGDQQKRWNDIGISTQVNKDGKPITNGNQVLAHNAGACRSNSAGTYLSLVAFVKNGDRAPVEAEIDRLATEIQPLITATGMAEAELFRSYKTPEGRSQGPIVVVYEHQYFAYQLERLRATRTPDTDRVLLYPKQEFQTDPEFISLKEGQADRLAELLENDPELRRRTMELGYRVLDGTSTTGSDQLFRYLTEQGVPIPVEPSDRTKAEFPELDLLERLITSVGRCQEQP